MPNNPNSDDRVAVAPQPLARPSASSAESARLSQKAARYCLCRRQSIEFLPVRFLFLLNLRDCLARTLFLDCELNHISDLNAVE